mgnify:CR=1 FL=1
MNTIDNIILDRVNVWLTPTFDAEIQEDIKKMMANDPEGWTMLFINT